MNLASMGDDCGAITLAGSESLADSEALTPLLVARRRTRV
jgi:hypothetical protein